MASNDVVIDETHGLHERVHGGWTDEAEATRLEILGHSNGFAGGRDKFGGWIESAGAIRSELLNVVIQRVELPEEIDSSLGIVDGGHDFAAVSDDAGIGEQALNIAFIEGGNGVDIEVSKRSTKVVSLAKDGEPRQPRLEAFKAHLFEQASVVGDVLSPLGVVIVGVQRIIAAPPAANQPIGTKPQPFGRHDLNSVRSDPRACRSYDSVMAFAHNGSCQLYYETFGDRGDPALLMVNGLGSQCINYQQEWCELFVARGLFVIRYDNRDVGLSTKCHGEDRDYRLADMAADGIAILDDLGIDRSHVMGLSLGGMIVQTMAINHPDRLRSMTSVMSRTGEPGFGDSTPAALALLLAAPATDRESAVQMHADGLREWGSPAYADEHRWRLDAERAFDRCFCPDGVGRQFRASARSGNRGAGLRLVTTPTLVMHGSADTLITPSGGQRTADLIPGARFELIEGMGHDYPPELWQRWTDLVADFALAHP